MKRLSKLKPRFRPRAKKEEKTDTINEDFGADLTTHERFLADLGGKLWEETDAKKGKITPDFTTHDNFLANLVTDAQRPTQNHRSFRVETESRYLPSQNYDDFLAEAGLLCPTPQNHETFPKQTQSPVLPKRTASPKRTVSPTTSGRQGMSTDLEGAPSSKQPPKKTVFRLFEPLEGFENFLAGTEVQRISPKAAGRQPATTDIESDIFKEESQVGIFRPNARPSTPELLSGDFWGTKIVPIQSESSQCTEVVELLIGDGPDTKTFHSNVDVLSRHSFQLELFFNQNPTVDVVVFPKWDPLLFELFEKFILTRPLPVLYQPCQYFKEETWDTTSLSACYFAMHLSSPQFLRYALSIFIQNCAMEPVETWEKNETDAPDGSSLMRFGNHWVAWNIHLAGGGLNEYTGLKAESLVKSVTDDTRDPRILDLEHWFSKCGDSLKTGCDHDPIEQRKRWELEHKRELKRRKAEQERSEYDDEAIMLEVQANSVQQT